MEINADLIARSMMRRAAEYEVLALERDALAQDNERLRMELAARDVPKGPVAVPEPETPAC